MSKYIKKAIPVNAFQMTLARMNDNEDWPEYLCEAWQTDHDKEGSLRIDSMDGDQITSLSIYTLEGRHIVKPDAWIVQGPNPPHEIWAVRDDIFQATYELIEE